MSRPWRRPLESAAVRYLRTCVFSWRVDCESDNQASYFLFSIVRIISLKSIHLQNKLGFFSNIYFTPSVLVAPRFYSDNVHDNLGICFTLLLRRHLFDYLVKGNHVINFLSGEWRFHRLNDHPKYGNLGPCDTFYSPKIKLALKRGRFAALRTAKQNATDQLKTIVKRRFLQRMRPSLKGTLEQLARRPLRWGRLSSSCQSHFFPTKEKQTYFAGTPVHLERQRLRSSGARLKYLLRKKRWSLYLRFAWSS